MTCHRFRQADSEFLAAQGIMDYSILLGIHYRSREHTVNVNPIHLVHPAVEGFSEGHSHDEDDVQIEHGEGPRQSVPLMEDQTRRTPLRHFLRYGFPSGWGMDDYVYSIGIIDILQNYNCDKMSENAAKRCLKRTGTGISAVPPPAYSERFINFVDESLIKYEPDSP